MAHMQPQAAASSLNVWSSVQLLAVPNFHNGQLFSYNTCGKGYGKSLTHAKSQW